MPQPSFRGDPYEALGVEPESTDAAIKRRWRELARESHPDRAVSRDEQAGLTARMARINAAYDVLRDPTRRARYDATRGRTNGSRSREDRRRDGEAARPTGGAPAGPPPPRPTRPVTARFDASATFQTRNARTTQGTPPLAGHRPIQSRELRGMADPLRASQPNGPVERRRTRSGAVRMPTLQEARAATLEFGRFRGHTLGEIEIFEPTYIDWIAKTITRDRDLVRQAQVIQSEMDQRGVVRRVRPSGAPGRSGEEAAGSAG